jgi:AraC-like DNA-binding protein
LGKSIDGVSWLLHQDDETLLVPVAQRMQIDNAFWRATIERQDVGTGLRVFLTSADVRQALTLEPHHHEPVPWLVSDIAVKGTIRLELSDGPSAEISPSQSVIFRPEDRRARFSPNPTRDLRMAGFMISADRLDHMFGGEMPEIVAATIEAGSDASPLQAIPASGRLRQLAGSLFTCRLQGTMRLIFMEGVVLQLLVEQAATSSRRDTRRARRLTHRDQAAIADARDRLFSDLRSPPSLAFLAAEAGMSEKALNSGFRAMYGTTVFETLRDKRLDDARQLLEAWDLPMKTVAFRLGYTHVSNFTRAFTRRFGAPPRRYANRR